MHQYGPFINLMSVAAALVSLFSTMLLKSVGRVSKWTWLVTETPSFMVTAGARAVAVSIMALTYVTISPSNHQLFATGAVLAGLLCAGAIWRFDLLRRPLLAPNGKQLTKHGIPRSRAVLIGSEAQLLTQAAAALQKAREERGGISLRQFMSGYGAQSVNDPEALWDRGLLAGIGAALSTLIMLVMLSAVVALFLGAFVIYVHGATAP
ncbi:MAG: hypothetical protein IPP07_17785 [Holophagales bacterium]|nr:hypothetical protein [Holophagales bacterium]